MNIVISKRHRQESRAQTQITESLWRHVLRGFALSRRSVRFPIQGDAALFVIIAGNIAD